MTHHRRRPINLTQGMPAVHVPRVPGDGASAERYSARPTPQRWATAAAWWLAMLGASLALAATPPALDWRSADGGHGIPDQTPAGYTAITLTANGHTDDTLVLYRLHPDAVPGDLMEASARIDAAFAGTGDVIGAINDALDVADMVAELHVQHGDRRSVGVVLVEGRYVLEHGSPTSLGMLRSYHVFTAAGDGGAAAPTPDVHVEMSDFAFAIPAEIAGGTRVWRVVNRGQQIHHMVLVKLDVGKTAEDFSGWFTAQTGQVPGFPMAHVGVSGSGEEGFHSIFLPQGNYVAVCFTRDHAGEASGRRHIEIGMLQAFSVVAPVD